MKINVKHLITLAIATFLMTACGTKNGHNDANESTIDSADMAVIIFDKPSYNFGTIVQGDTVHYSYVFTNNGKTPLQIFDAVPSCGCTTPTFTKTPIAPGEKGNIDVVFNSTNFVGQVIKAVQIISNAKTNPTVIQLEGDITPKK